MRHLVCASLALAALIAVPAAAQQPDSEATAPAAPEQQLPPAQRRQLETRLRERIAQVVQTQLQLTDDQMRQLQEVNARYEEQRRQLVQQEQYLRLSLRAQLALGDQADQSRVSGYIDQLSQIQQQRLEIFRNEQADLSRFMTPVQRAKYAALQEQLRRRIAQMRQRIIQQRQLRREQRLDGPRPLRPRRRPY
jgi:Spy/CpxP family protein refolding chaperone